MKIVCVCGMGLGSSVIAKMNIEQVLKKMGLSATVDTCDLGSIRSVPADLYVTTRELAVSMPAEVQSKTIVLTNFVRKVEIESSIGDYLKNLV
ncbi:MULTISPECIES: PTS sugar transporter subunit IIB [Enterobacteriaceae]|uniref:PTS sugar transporter subunit IIB n=1 Tax=Klebsiella aerogenes TaxID=548 RepID=A0AAP9R287_KLEAE|nr:MULTISPECIES: PTS sugar transporter subunit IIB [Enterobacteriaceae]EFH8759554.1 PTS maltose transporter subunit IIABC [Escherichia coli]EFJ1988253.1 PTS sugar transporter subunit IIB [Escherichia coli]EFL9576184.1 PTS sugar transporter subunit IIB [Escherichia coli]EFO6492431.1 PTS sugar transporter subunit IIB [Escherichia coli]EFT1906845.1 PTS sugar transporter subunit IIB [Escherichia coli]